MSRRANIYLYQGKAIDDVALQKRVKEICEERYAKKIARGDKSFLGICEYEYFGNHTDDEYALLGTNWYMEYAVSDNGVDIDNLISSGNDPFQILSEMRLAFSWLLREYRDREFYAVCNPYSGKLVDSLEERNVIKMTKLVQWNNDGYSGCSFVPTEEFLEKLGVSFDFEPVFVFKDNAENPSFYKNEKKIVAHEKKMRFKPKKKN